MKLDKIATVLLIIGGIIQLITAYRMFFVKYFIFKLRYPGYAYVFIIAGIVWLIIGILMLCAANLMKNKKRFKLATILSLVISILGLNVVSFIGAIFGFVHLAKNRN